ncbi:MAG: DUF2182 domain-containing protein [Gemmatimonadota bacterium]|nr:MAG: DUF2182 domain-containing protein [Gemmatimonadota bacterium]
MVATFGDRGGSAALPSLAGRDRAAILVALVGVTGLAWLYLVVTAAAMTGGSGSMDMVALRPWSLADAFLVFLMWAVMMVGMMVPSVAPTTMVYAAVARKAAREGSIVASTATFVAGYVFMWTLFSGLATLAQWGLETAALVSPLMVATSPALGAGLLIGAGLYQITPAKAVCLRKCRSPVHFISEHWRIGASGALRMGFELGAFCLGCCWLLMALLFVGGVMNLLWIALIAGFVLVEKLLPHGRLAGQISGGAMILVGVGLLATWLR